MPCAERSVVQVGRNLAVNLPAGWTRAAGVKAGDKVHLDFLVLLSEIPGIEPVYSEIVINKKRKPVDRVPLEYKTPSELIADLRRFAEEERGTASDPSILEDEDERKEYLMAAERADRLAAAFEKSVKDGDAIVGALFAIDVGFPGQHLVLLLPERKGRNRRAQIGGLADAWDRLEKMDKADFEAYRAAQKEIMRANAPEIVRKMDEIMAEQEAFVKELEKQEDGVRKHGKSKRQG